MPFVQRSNSYAAKCYLTHFGLLFCLPGLSLAVIADEQTGRRCAPSDDVLAKVSMGETDGGLDFPVYPRFSWEAEITR